MTEVAYPFRDQLEAVDTLARLAHSGTMALSADLEPVLETLPAGWRTLLEIQLICPDDWFLSVGDAGVEISMAAGERFVLPCLNVHLQALQARAAGPATLEYLILGK